MKRWLIALALILPGCSFLNPGGDVRKAAEVKNETTWDANSNFNLKEDTTHNRRVLMAEQTGTEESIRADYYPDGSPKTIQGATHLLSQWSEPKDVLSAYTHLADRNLQAFDRFAGLIERMIPLLEARIVATAPAPAPANNRLDTVRAYLNVLTPAEKDALAIELGVSR